MDKRDATAPLAPPLPDEITVPLSKAGTVMGLIVGAVFFLLFLGCGIGLAMFGLSKDGGAVIKLFYLLGSVGLVIMGAGAILPSWQYANALREKRPLLELTQQGFTAIGHAPVAWSRVEAVKVARSEGVDYQLSLHWKDSGRKKVFKLMKQYVGPEQMVQISAFISACLSPTIAEPLKKADWKAKREPKQLKKAKKKKTSDKKQDAAENA